MIKKICLLTLLINLLSQAEEIPHTLIIDNPDRPITTLETMKKKDKGELNLNIKKVTTKEIKGYINKDQNIISFYLTDKDISGDFYLAKTKDIFNKYTRQVNDINGFFPLNRDLNKKTISFKYDVLPDEIYLINYNKSNMNLINLYKTKEKDLVNIKLNQGELKFVFNEAYKPLEIINISKESNKGQLYVSSGKKFEIDPLIAEDIKIKDMKGNILGIISLKNGNGLYKLDNSKKGIFLKNESSILNLGIGVKNSDLFIQIKGVTDSSKEYPMILEVKNIDGSTANYSLTLKAPQYGFKILNTQLDLNFENTVSPQLIETNDKSLNKITNNQLKSTSEILIDSKGLDIKASFINNGVIKLKKGNDIVTGRLEAVVPNNPSTKDIKSIQVIGTIDKKELENKSEGEYLGSTELLIEIDS